MYINLALILYDCRISQPQFLLTRSALVIAFSVAGKVGGSAFARVEEVGFSGRDAHAPLLQETALDVRLEGEGRAVGHRVTLCRARSLIRHCFVSDLTSRKHLKFII